MPISVCAAHILLLAVREGEREKEREKEREREREREKIGRAHV